jgi:hypothetical protein
VGTADLLKVNKQELVSQEHYDFTGNAAVHTKV